MKHDFTIWRNQILENPRDISPLKFGMSQDEVIEIFGNPDAVSTMRSDGKPLILKYCDIELHFDRKAPHGLYLVYSDELQVKHAKNPCLPYISVFYEMQKTGI